MNTENKLVKEVCDQLDGGSCLEISPPYTPVGNGQIKEVEWVLDEYYKEYESIPDTLMVEGRMEFENSVLYSATGSSFIFSPTAFTCGTGSAALVTTYNYWSKDGKQVKSIAVKGCS